MLMLVFTIALGIVFAVFATQNTARVDLIFGNRVLPHIPIYLVALAPLLIGLVLAYFIYLARSLSQRLTISELKDKINNLKKGLAETTKEAHKYELETTKLKAKNGEPEDENSI